MQKPVKVKQLPDMQNPFEVLEKELSDIKEILHKILNSQNEPKPIAGIDLNKYISLQDVTEMYGLSSQGLYAHMHEIEYVKRFRQIYFLKESLAKYMEEGKPVIVMKKIMRTRKAA